ncbi:MAG: SpoIIE family protein phosphatase [Planctomycetaceae bacterium]|nr:SpoIIE family protein phosphatase [Planctomycetaceae bacterium]
METKLETTSCSQGPVLSADVLFVGDRPLSFDLIEQMNQARYLWDTVSLPAFESYMAQHPNCGTIVIDCSDIPAAGEQALGRLIEQIDNQDIPVICYGCPADLNFDHLVLGVRTNSIEFGELWARIDSNIRFSSRLRRRTETPMPNAPCTLSGDTAQQLEMAGRVQRNFLPARLPDTERIRWAALFRPAEWVSGDIYDIARLDEEHIGFYLADAVGHSVPAALLTMFLKQATVMRQTIGECYFIYRPADVIKNLNLRMIEQELNGCLFATCFYGLLNIRTLQLDYARAGHPYPVIMRDGQLMALQTRGGLLGVFETSEFEQHTIQLHAGDKLFVYSDGGEALIGQNKEDGSLEFSNEFRGLADLPIDEMLKTFGQWAADYKFAPGQLDDVTAVGLEIIA